jgi:predicted LPLAT superfamily acyltransferase
MWFMYWIHRLFGRWPFRVLLFPVVLYFVVVRRRSRNASLDYLRHLEAATGALGHTPSWADVFRHIYMFSESVLDRALALTHRYEFENVTAENRETMLELLDQKRGGVLLTAHMGNLDVARVASGHRPDFKVNVLVHTRHAERFNRVIQRLNPHCAINLLQVTELNAATAMMLSERIDRGEFVAIAGDRIPVGQSSRQVVVPFLGRPAAFPVGPYALAALLRCPIVLMLCRHSEKGYVVRFEMFRERAVVPRAERAEAFKALARDFAQRLEENCRRSPFDWFNFFRFWLDEAGTKGLP